MNGAGVQELLALGIVALVVGLTLWRRNRRKKTAGACSGCDTPPAGQQEKPLRFYKKKP